jgi:predicted O-methyltransferase YrrM
MNLTPGADSGAGTPSRAWSIRGREIAREMGANATVRSAAVGGLTATAVRLAGWTNASALMLGSAAGEVMREVAQRGREVEREARNSADAAALAAWLGPNMRPLGAWAIEADFARLIVAEASGAGKVVVECGSGATTLLLAWALRQNGGGRLYSLEHDARYAREMIATLERAGLSDQVELIVAPLAAQPFDGTAVVWYDLSIAGERLPERVDLVIVDGPPAISPWARWPAMTVFANRLDGDGAILMDDGRRAHERRVAYRWASEHPDFDLFWFDTVKGTWRLKRRSGPPAGTSRLQAAYRRLRRAVNPYPVGYGRWPVQR